ncbi:MULTISPECIES: hypothetical protein [Bacillus cereus group]|uniref:hypothetical protein n=1 Tax=Bacillus cereus group TaxID=86661 RepID=UPI0005A331F1|nr:MULTISPECIES: hypothetical protein [Bacillus cereus group]AJG57288.1 hypothetical protein AW22_5263 [Bacillus cereus D17]QKI12726.1 hypothetical protein FOC91_12260 [Bacillus cereus]USL02018.1 hypothetical protein LIS83_24660 [Bacillus anthracis]
MNGVLSASKLMKASEVIKKCVEAKNSPAQMFVEETRRRRELEEMNRKDSSRREVS